MIRLSDAVRKQVRQFDSCTQQNVNCIRFDTKSGLKHKLAVLGECRSLLINGTDFFTRARLKENNACADLYSIPENLIVEFADSESEESIDRKKKLWESRGFNFMAESV